MNVKGKIRFELESPVAYEMYVNINSVSAALNATALIQHQISLLKSIEQAESQPKEPKEVPAPSQTYIEESSSETLN
jgi:hypothetical protein